MSESVLVVDDEREIADLVEVFLKNDGYRVYKCYNGTDAMAYVENEKIDLAILDVMLPDMDGFTMCQKIRQNYFFPIIMLTAKVENQDKITGLTMGADDYITKPFQPTELVARVKTQLRRYKRYNMVQTQSEEETEEYNIRGLYISKVTHKVMLNEEELSLTPIEFKILLYLCEHQHEVVSTEELYENVWGDKYLDSNNTVMAHIARLREKMKETARKPKYVKTIWGVGYTIE